MARLQHLRIGTLLLIIMVVSTLGTFWVTLGAFQHRADELAELKAASLHVNVVTTAGRGVISSETLTGLAQVEYEAAAKESAAGLLVTYNSVLNAIRADAQTTLQASIRQLRALSSNPALDAELRGRVASMVESLEALEGEGAGFVEQRDSIRHAYFDLVNHVKELGGLPAETTSLISLTMLSCRVLETAMSTYLPDTTAPDSAFALAVDNRARELAAVDQLRLTLPTPHDAAFVNEMTTGRQGVYLAKLAQIQESFWSPEATLVRTTDLDIISLVAERLRIVTSYQAEVADNLLAESEAAHSQGRHVAYIYVLGAILSALITQLVSFTVARTIRRRLARSADLAADVAKGERINVTAPDVVRNELDRIDSALATAGDLVAQVSDATSAIARGEVELTIALPGAVGEATRMALDRIVKDRAALVDSLELVGAILSSAPSAIWTLDEQGVITRANGEAVRIVGRPHVGRHYTSIAPALDLDATSGSEIALMCADGVVPVLISASPVSTSQGPVYVLIAHDISERKKFENTLATMAVTDSLTGLPNRAGVTAALEQRSSRREQMAVLFIDLDRFKAVNDTYGHAAGDELLVLASQRISAAVKETDVAGRLGGDEFVVLLADTDENDAATIAGRLLEAIKVPYKLSSCTAVIGASIGVTTTRGGVAAGDLLGAADAAMYTAKTAGRGRVMTYDLSMSRAQSSRAALESDLRAAVAAEQLSVVYQPIVSLDSEEVVGHEMLVRWDHQGRQVPPSLFIPIAEEIGVVADIGLFMLDQAAAALARDGNATYLSVNISGAHLARGNLADDVQLALSRHRVPGKGLVIEVTETSLVTDMESAIEQLNRLRSLGVAISLDDFGTGYASLNYLRSLPADILKIDAGFVIGGVDREIVSMIVNLASTLNLTVVAEGVETRESRAILTDLGCHCGQGYLFGRPAPGHGKVEALFNVQL